ncbi:MAG: hypothetical protein ABIW30_02210, partial [Arenimonas sp.]
QEKALSMPVQGREEDEARADALADVQRLLGNPDAAWALMAPVAGTPSLPNGYLLALKPYYDALHAKSAAYRAYMADLESKR